MPSPLSPQLTLSVTGSTPSLTIFKESFQFLQPLLPGFYYAQGREIIIRMSGFLRTETPFFNNAAATALCIELLEAGANKLPSIVDG
jgi:hypothetical protein